MLAARLRLSLFVLGVGCASSQVTAQVCNRPDVAQIWNDNLPADLSAYPSRFAVIRGICVDDKAAAVFDVSSLPSPVRVAEGGIVFAGPAGSQPMTTQMEVFDGVTFQPNGQATLGPRVYVDVFPQTLQLNALNLLDISAFNVDITSGQLGVAFSVTTNPNGSCGGGYTASFAADISTPATGRCTSPCGRNLIFDPGNGEWWDVARFQISGINWCGFAFDGSWLIRACVELPGGAFDGTGADLGLVTGVGAGLPSGVRLKTAEFGDSLIVGLNSPNGTLVNEFAALLISLYPTNGAPPLQALPMLYASPTSPPVVISTPSLSMPLVRTFSVPLGLEGVRVMFQGAALSPAFPNGLFGSSDAHVILIQ